MRGMKRETKVVLVLSLLLAIVVTIYLRLDRPYIGLQHQKNSVAIDVQTLGEYPTTVSHIRLTEVSSGKVVFEVVRDHGTPQLHTFTLAAGDNTTDLIDPQSGDYRIATPVTDKKFSLRFGEEYKLAIWGSGWLSNTVSFKIQ